MTKVSASEGAGKWVRRISAATEDVRAGVERVSEAPTKKAAEKQDKMRAGILGAIDSGKWAKGLGRVTLEDWKGRMLEKGVGRIASGASDAESKVVAFNEKFYPHLDSGQAKVKKMPDVTLDDSINRMVAMCRHNASFKR